MESVVDRLELVCRRVVGLHRVGEYQAATGLEYAGRLGADLGTITGMKERILRPDQVERGFFEVQRSKISVDHLDIPIEARLDVHPSVALVFDLAQVQRYTLATEMLGQVAHRTTVAGTEIKHPGGGIDFAGELGHTMHGSTAGVRDGLVIGLVKTDMDVLTAPDVEIEIIRIGAVVVCARSFDHVRILLAAHALSTFRVVWASSSSMSSAP